MRIAVYKYVGNSFSQCGLVFSLGHTLSVCNKTQHSDIPSSNTNLLLVDFIWSLASNNNVYKILQRVDILVDFNKKKIVRNEAL